MSSKALFKKARPAEKIIDCSEINRICSLIEEPNMSIYSKAQKIKSQLIEATVDNSIIPLLEHVDDMIANKNYTSAADLANDVWLIYRRGGIGGSDASSLLGLSKWNTGLSLYYDKIGEKPPENVSVEKQYIFDFGHAMEEFVALHYEKVFINEFKESVELEFSLQYGQDLRITKCRVYRDTWMYKNPEHPFMRADLDFCVDLTFSDGRVATGIFECKTTSPFSIRESWEAGPPKYYECQTRHYMAVMDYPFTIIACAADNNSNNYYSHVIFRNKKKENEIVSAEERFWNQVQNRVPPYELGKNNKDLLLAKSDELSENFVKDDSQDLQQLIKKVEDVEDQLQLIKAKEEELTSLKDVACSDVLTYMTACDSINIQSTMDEIIYNLSIKESSRTTTDWKKIIKTIISNHPEIEKEINEIRVENQKVKKTKSLNINRSTVDLKNVS